MVRAGHGCPKRSVSPSRGSGGVCLVEAIGRGGLARFATRGRGMRRAPLAPSVGERIGREAPGSPGRPARLIVPLRIGQPPADRTWLPVKRVPAREAG